MNNVSKQELAELLRRAKKAHSRYEQKLGREDDDWTDWYAEFIINQLDNE